MDNSEAINRHDEAEQSSAQLRVPILDVLRQRERELGRGRSWQRGAASDEEGDAG